MGWSYLPIPKLQRYNRWSLGWINNFTPHFTRYVYIMWSWWRHQMESFSALLALCAGNSPVPVNSPHKGQWRGALMFSLICAWINDWTNNREAGDSRRHHGHFDVNVMCKMQWCGHPVLFQRCVTENGCNYWHRNGNVDIMMTSSNGILFCVTGTLCGEFTGHRWIPLKKASDGELRCFLWSACINGWENNREAGDSRRHRTHYDVIVTILRELLPLAAPKVVILTTSSVASDKQFANMTKFPFHRRRNTDGVSVASSRLDTYATHATIIFVCYCREA